ncbi:MAG: VTT domain-containing protein [Deltaproteobacteria bacterium]|nr:VTT domain-containing protein [Deltaproteobacteria bacterium]
MREGRNAWRVTRAGRVAFILEAERFFSLWAAAGRRARRSIYICGWDLDHGLLLRPTDGQPAREVRLDRFLNQLCENQPALRIHVLLWNFTSILPSDPEPRPVLDLGWRTGRGVIVRWDSQHPPGACLHQKFVVVDGELAFCGGRDLATRTWASPSPGEPVARGESGSGGRPARQDLQMVVDGPAAGHLAELFRARWRGATGEELPIPPRGGPAPWPEDLAPETRGAAIGVVRTQPAFQGRPAVGEMRELCRDLVAAARECIYLQSRYFTSPAVGEALGRSLSLSHGPAVVLVLPRRAPGWLDPDAMKLRRRALLDRLVAADRHGRLAVYQPREELLDFNATLLVADDLAALVGSAEMTERSLAWDAECGLVLAAGRGGPAAGVVTGLRDRLLAGHLGVTPADLRRAVERHGGLLSALDAFSQRGGRLVRWAEEPQDAWDQARAEGAELAGPEPLRPAAYLLERFLPDESRKASQYKAWKFLAFLLGLGILAAAWRWGPLARWLNPEALGAAIASLRGSPWAPLVVTAGFVVGSLVMVPLTFMIGLVAVTFSPAWAVAYSLLGGVVSSLTGYGLGRCLGRETVRRLAGGRLNRLSKQVARRGLLSVVALRLIPVTHYTIINIIAGACHVRLGDFVLGTALGFLPGIIVVSAFADRVQAILRHPGTWNILVSAAALMGAVLGLFLLVRWVRHRQGGER